MLRIDPARKISFLEGFPSTHLVHFFTLKALGNLAQKYGMEAKQNQGKVWFYLEEMGLSPEHWIHLVPSRDPSMIIISRPEEIPSEKRSFKGNAVITLERNTVLSLFPADCYPVFITDRAYSFLALIHGSLAAVKKGIVERTIDVLLESESDTGLEELIVGVGPGIGKCCYQRRFRKIDLLEMILQQLPGIPEKNIFTAGICTACSKWNDDYLFFSHRRSQLTGEPEGRFGAFVALKDP